MRNGRHGVHNLRHLYFLGEEDSLLEKATGNVL